MSYETETKQETGCNIIVTDIKIFPFKVAGICHIRALANIVLNDALILRGIRIMEGYNGMYLSYPVDPFFNGVDYRSLIVPITREVREYIENEVLKQYHKEVANG